MPRASCSDCGGTGFRQATMGPGGAPCECLEEPVTVHPHDPGPAPPSHVGFMNKLLKCSVCGGPSTNGYGTEFFCKTHYWEHRGVKADDTGTATNEDDWKPGRL